MEAVHPLSFGPAQRGVVLSGFGGRAIGEMCTELLSFGRPYRWAFGLIDPNINVIRIQPCMGERWGNLLRSKKLQIAV